MDTSEERTVHKPKRVVPTYRGMGMSLTSNNHLSVEQEKKVLDDISARLIGDPKATAGKAGTMTNRVTRDAMNADALEQLREDPDAYFERTHKEMPEMFRREPEPTQARHHSHSATQQACSAHSPRRYR